MIRDSWHRFQSQRIWLDFHSDHCFEIISIFLLSDQTCTECALQSLFVFLLEGFDGVEAAGGVDLTVAGVFCGVEQTLSSDKGKVIKKERKKKYKKPACFLRTFQGSLLKVFISPSEWLQIAHIKSANQLVLGRLLCRKWPVKKSQDCQSTKS